MRLERHPVALRRGARRPSRPAASKAARTSASRSMKIPDATRMPPGRSSSRSAAGQRHEHARRSGSRATTSKAGSPLGRLPTRARGSAARCRCGVAFAAVASIGDRVGVDADARAAPSRIAAIARIPEPHPTSRTRAPASASRGRRPPRARRGRAASSGAGRSRTPCPGRARGRLVGGGLVAAPRRADDQPAADPQHREVRLPGIGPVGLVDDPRPQLADRPQPERLQVAERVGDPDAASASAAAGSRAGR